MSAMCQVLFFALIFTNSVDAPSGTSHLVTLVWAVQFCFTQLSAFNRTVSLGRKVIPWAGTMQTSFGIDRMDFILKILLSFMVFFTVSSVIFATIGCFVKTEVLDQTSIICILINQAIFTVCFIYQVSTWAVIILHRQNLTIQLTRTSPVSTLD